MKKILPLSIAFLSFSCQQPKTAFVDISKLVDDYEEMKDVKSAFETKTASFTKRRDSVVQAYQLEEQDFRIKAQKMTRKQQEENYQLLAQKGQILGQQFQNEQQQIQLEGQQQIDSLIKKVKDFIKDYGKNNDYTYIYGSNQTGSVLYGKEENDITTTLLTELNKAYNKD